MTYTNNIPVPTNPPASDVTNMQNNTIAVNNWVQVDHVGFNASNSGYHEQVHFATNNVPSIPTLAPTLFTNVQDGAGNPLPGSIAQLLFYSGNTTALTSNQYLVGASGSIFLFMGIILKWGVINFVTTSATVTFANAYPNNLFTVVTGANTTTPSTNGAIGVGALTTSGFNAFHAGAGALTAYYLAIGN